MPPITALLHTCNDALRLGRSLETLFPCDEIVVVDHGSHDATLRTAREYGARIIAAEPGIPLGHYLQLAHYDWIFCLEPRESLAEGLWASLLEWKPVRPGQEDVVAFSVFLREETPEGWLDLPEHQTRLVPRDWNRWQGFLPALEPAAVALEGELLRFLLP